MIVFTSKRSFTNNISMENGNLTSCSHSLIVPMDYSYHSNIVLIILVLLDPFLRKYGYDKIKHLKL